MPSLVEPSAELVDDRRQPHQLGDQPALRGRQVGAWWRGFGGHGRQAYGACCVRLAGADINIFQTLSTRAGSLERSEAFHAGLRRIEDASKGIKLTKPYRKDPAMNNLPSAGMIDPWGVSIELTEGLRDIP